MGQQESLVGNYSVGRFLLEQSDEFPWSICPGWDDDDTDVTLFIHKQRCNSPANQLYWLENGVQHLRSIRHPHVVKFLDYLDDDELDTSSGLAFCVVTSIVAPLQQEIHSMTALEISNGLAGIGRALQFLHDQCQLSHNNVYNQAVFVSESGCKWQLGCFELACPFSAVTTEYLSQIEVFRHEEAIPPEDKEDCSLPVRICPHARDVYAFGVLVESLLEMLASLGSVADDFELNSAETVLNPDPMFRPCFAVLLTDPLFSGEVTQIIDFLSNITVKSKEEKEEFFSSLPSRLRTTSDDVIVRLILPLLINRFVLNEPAAIDKLLPHLLVANRDTASSSNGLLPVQLYKDHVLPMIIKLFMVHEVNIRLSLLQYWPHYVPLCDREILHEEILPELLIGLQDDNPLIVSSTFRALGDLVPVLGVQAVTGEEPDHIFVENKPRFAAGSLSSKLQSPQSPLSPRSTSLSAHMPSMAQSPKHLPSGHVESGLVNNHEKLLEKREKRRKQREEARKQKELRSGSTVRHSPMKLVQAVKVSSNTIHEDSEERDLELERKRAEQEREERKEAEKRIREMEQLQHLTDARLKGMSQKEIDAWDEALSARDRRSSSDDDWETPFSEPIGSHEKPSSRKSRSRQNSQWQNKDSWSDFNTFEEDHGGEDMRKGVIASQPNTRTLRDQKNPMGNKFVDFLDTERQERERVEAMPQQLEGNEVDLFADMQPVVAKNKKSESRDEVKRNTLNYTMKDTVDEGGWGDGDWGDELQ